MTRRPQKRPLARKGAVAASTLGIGAISLVLVGCIGIGFAVAGGTVSEDNLYLGVGENATRVSLPRDVDDVQVAFAADASESGLAQASPRDVSAGVARIQEEQARAEAERLAAEEEARLAEEARLEAERLAAEEAERARIAELEAQQAAASQAAAESQVSVEEPSQPALSEIDWGQGRESFIAEWTTRIDAYLAGSPLAGYGSVFATAAWDNGVDPRLSPAISNTESTKGSFCFLPYNAWGWGDSSWSSWEEAINAHVAGLAAGYGGVLTPAGAAAYCPPHATDWYNKTLSQMQSM
ncbi:CMP-2-keto-3-deoxyoctulosonic acid synthetase [Adlercreutzia aquisgranensis]|uniref:CMP-2-keto-3-deoxyoctulosonic acid synthetase n=1 Tax=Adlercreutzia aquisgranensis TaxID=2941323 RepID=UPI00204114C8|nr:CMP-2-keto-3-deoxyoctulosonic acid synthetase [Adlercreutzia aquisgranensis]